MRILTRERRKADGRDDFARLEHAWMVLRRELAESAEISQPDAKKPPESVRSVPRYSGEYFVWPGRLSLVLARFS